MKQSHVQEQPFDAHADVDANGIDLARLRRNLARPLEMRIERNRAAAVKTLECRRAAESAIQAVA